MSETEFNAVIDYLQDKYFEPVTNPGDYNADGKVDAADYVRWRKSPVGIVGDPAGQVTWRNYFSEAPAGAGSGLEGGSVPEPSALIFVANFAALSFLGIRRRFVRQRD
jgi:hypothetical protein